MSYATNITKDHVDVNYFIRLGSRVEITDTWSSFSHGGDTIYYLDWTDAPVGALTWTNYDGANFVAQSGKVIEAYSYEKMLAPTTDGNVIDGLFFDSKLKRLFLNSPTTPVNNVLSRMYAERFYYLSTIPIGFHNKPDDDRFPDVQYQGILNSIPTISSSVNQVIYGFIPTQSGSISVANENNYFSGGFFEGSLSNCTFEIYRCVGEILAENTQLIFRGFTRNASYSDGFISINYVDASALLDNNLYTPRYLESATSIEPAFRGNLYREMFCGVNSRLLAHCTSYSASKAINTNRVWRFGQYFSPAGVTPSILVNNYTTNNALSGSNTTTRTYLDSLGAIEVGWWLVSQPSSSKVVEVTGLGANYINHTALASPLGNNDYFSKSWVQSATLIHKSTNVATPVTVDALSATSNYNLTFINDAETTLGLGTEYIHTEDYSLFGDIHNSTGVIDFLDTGNALGSANPATDENQNPVQLIYECLYGAGFYNHSGYYDSASFIATASATDIYLSGFSPLANNATQPETFRDIIGRICETALLKVFMKNGRWFVSKIEPFTAVTQSLTSTEIEAGFSYKLDADEVVKDVIVQYDRGDVDLLEKAVEESFRKVTTVNGASQGLNNNSKTLNVSAMVADQAVAETIRDRYSYIFSRPLGVATFTLDLSSIGLSLDDIVTILVEDFNGIPFTADKTFSVISIKENIDSIEVELFDQAGIEENSGSW